MLNNKTVGFLIISLLSFGIHAENDTKDFFALQPNSYIGSSIFYNQHSLETSSRSTQSTSLWHGKGNTGFGIQVGNFYGENLGIEMYYQHFASPWITPGQRLTTNAFGASLISRMFLIPRIYAWLDLGLIRMATKVNCTLHSTDCLHQTGQLIRNTSPRISAGLAAILAPHLSLAVGYHTIYRAVRFPRILVNQIKGFEVTVDYLF